MECNRDEAVRAKEIAERKLTEGEYLGSKKFVLKAQNLYPELEGLSDLLTTLDVYISSENKIAGERDWYGILGVNPWADEETVKKQFRKLAFALHPDKNKCVGADGAFKLVSEAWSLLSDKAKRLVYNQKRNSRVFQQKAPTNGATSNPRARDTSTRVGPKLVPSPPSYQRTSTFWTLCNGCKTHYEYLRVYLNHTLLCPNCQEAFFATERAPPPNVLKPTNGTTSNSRTRDSSSRVGPTAGIHSEFPSSSTTGHAHGYASNRTSSSTDKQLKKRRIGDDRVNGSGSFVVNQTAYGPRRGSSEGERIYGFSNTNNTLNSSRELSLFELRSMLIDKSKIELRNKLKEWRAADKGKENKLQSSSVNGNACGQTQNKKGDKEVSKPTSMNVPDSDFHNFDMDRTEKSFGDDQVWAAYDDDDGMPRYYARIHKVTSLRPFRMKFSWLNSRSNTEFSPLDWTGSGFSKTCGDFRVGKYESIGSLNSFSHKVEWTKGTRGVICIYPRKGDVWALYRNWSPDWDEHTPDELVHKYDMVEVLDDYNEEQGVSVTPLVKVDGFRTVFRKHTDPCEIKQIPKEEMFRLSHQVPNYLLTGEEAPNAPKGCRELDPAATPLELLQETSEACEGPKVNGGIGALDETPQSAQER